MNPIERGWYDRSWFGSWFNYLLFPLSILFYVISTLRRALFKLGISKSFKAERPVIIVGNISVGGNGKTPFVIWLVELLKKHNIKAGVISRGYGGQSDVYPVAVDDSFDTTKFGDEPVLIHRRTGCPVVVGSDRVKNCKMLVEQYDCDIIISDDGMQHYRLKRDIEVAIVDAARQFGNGWLMPVGPLRELKSRLKTVDYTVYNGATDKVKNNAVSFNLATASPINILDKDLKPGHQFSANNGQSDVNAVCGIGNPQRFEKTLASMPINCQSFTAFSDHHHFSPADFSAFGDDTVLMTEKDAVKCQAFARPNWWYLPVDAKLPQDFEQQFLNHILSLIENR